MGALELVEAVESMEAVEKFNIVEQDLNNKIKNIRPKFVRTRTKSRVWKIAIICLSVTTTVVLGIKGINWGANVGFVLSAILTGVTTVEQLFNFGSKSVEEHEYYLKLTALRQRMEFYKTGKPLKEYTMSEVIWFFEEFNTIRAEFHNHRVETVRQSYEAAKIKPKP